jgi:hypothetical protein
LYAGTFVTVVTAAIGLMHTSAGAPILARLGGCPAMGVSAAEVNALRLRGVSGLRGTRPAPTRPALGFVLDHTTPADVEAWAVRAGVRCTSKKRGILLLSCKNVPRAALPEATGEPSQPVEAAPAADRPRVIEDLALSFDPREHLISIDALTRSLPAVNAAAAFSSSDARLAALLGPATETAGDSQASQLARTPLATSLRRYRFSDYIAIVTVSNLPSGLAVREQYLSGS